MNRSTRLAACFVTIAMLSAMSQAQSVLNVTAGAFTEVASQTSTLGVSDLTTFYFSAVDLAGNLYMFTGIPGEPPMGFYTCNFGCSLQSIEAIGKSVPFQIGAGPGSMWSVPNGNGTIQVYCWNQGSAAFTYTSGFSLNLDKTTGILTAKGLLAPGGATIEPGLPDGQGDCQPVAGLPAFTTAGNWQYAAQFHKSPSWGPGWFLIQQIVSPVP